MSQTSSSPSATALSKRLEVLLQEREPLLDSYPQLETAILDVMHAERMSIFQRRREYRDLVARYKTGSELPEIRVAINHLSVAGYVALSQRPLIINNPYQTTELVGVDPRLRHASQFDKSSAFTTRNMLCVPIVLATELIGVLQIINHNADGFTTTHLGVAQCVAQALGDRFSSELRGTSEPLQYLLQRQLISPSELTRILAESADLKTAIQRLHCELGIAEEAIGGALSVYYQVPYVAYSAANFQLYQGESRLNLSYLKRNLVAVIVDSNNNRIVLMADPKNTGLLMEVDRALDLHNYQLAVGLPSHILQYLSETDGQQTNLEAILEEIDSSPVDAEQPLDGLSEDAPAVVRLVSRVLHDAKIMGASDIHIDPQQNASTQVRIRVDGLCRELTQIPMTHHNAVIARIKIMASLNIAEKRMPQDGKLTCRVHGKSVEVRVATIPTVAGESAVMRLLNSGSAVPITDLNLRPRNLKTLHDAIQKPHGILLVVGPTGSGKTTTLHAILDFLNTPAKKIWTAEDPVEITQPGLQQVQINRNLGFTFGNALRAFLRADPDIILIGEMRDQETAHAGIEASLTGHLVLSTLHTNSAPESIIRLLDLGIDPVNFSDACVGILAQRLIRTLCNNCKQAYPASTADISFIQRQYGAAHLAELVLSPPVQLYKANGCDTCGGTGYQGRTGVHELLVMTPALRSLVYQGAAVANLRQQATKDGMRSLVQDGIYKVLQGETDLAQLQIISGAE